MLLQRLVDAVAAIVLLACWASAWSWSSWGLVVLFDSGWSHVGGVGLCGVANAASAIKGVGLWAFRVVLRAAAEVGCACGGVKC
jgi:hypothetical protein